jgi:hypothetical protein
MEKQTPYLAHQMSERADTSTGTAIRIARCGLLLEGLGFSYAQARWTQGFLSGSDRWSITSYVHWSCIACVLVRTRRETCSHLSLLMATRSFYSTRSGSYTKTQGPTSGPEVVGNWYPIQQLGY